MSRSAGIKLPTKKQTPTSAGLVGADEGNLPLVGQMLRQGNGTAEREECYSQVANLYSSAKFLCHVRGLDRIDHERSDAGQCPDGHEAWPENFPKVHGFLQVGREV